MDVERRLLLYVVVLGCAVGVGTLAVRRSSAFHAYAFQLVAIAAAACAGLLRDSLGAVLAWPLFVAWAVVAVAPYLLVTSGRRAAARRSYAAGARMVAVAAGILLLPRPLRREARLLAAFDAADRGDEELCRTRLGELAALDDGRPSPETSDLAAIVPAAAARRWGDVLRAVDASVARGPLVVSAEAAAAAETGDIRRALRAATELARWAPEGSAALAQARRAVLAAAGRAAFLEEAVRAGLPVAEGAPGAVPYALGRAYEARGEAEPAALAYREAAAASLGVLRRDAEEGARRCAAGEMRVARPDELELAALHDLERACRAERPDPSKRPILRRAPATVALCAATAVSSVAVLVLLGRDVLSLVAAGALSVPLVVDDGEWWRLASAMLLHGGVVHLVLNLASILVVGVPFEQRMGSVRTVIVYLASGLLASAASVHLAGTQVGVGASGAAMGLFGGLCVLLVLRPAAFEAAERRHWLGACAVILASNAAIGLLEHEAIDNAAHGGGLLAGAALAWVLLPAPLDSPLHRGARRLTAAVLLTVLAVSVGAVLRDLRDWTRSEVRTLRGARLEIPAWLRVEDRGALGAVATRRPLPFAVTAGVRGESWPDAAALVARVLGADPGDVHRWRSEDSAETRSGGLRRREHRWPATDDPSDPAAGPEAAVRAVVMERGGAVAAVVGPDDEEARAAFDSIVGGVARTLGPADGGSPR